MGWGLNDSGFLTFRIQWVQYACLGSEQLLDGRGDGRGLCVGSIPLDDLALLVNEELVRVRIMLVNAKLCVCAFLCM